MSKTDKQDRPKKRRGDRRDATLVRDTDTMHKFMPYLIPGRCNNEAFIEEFIDLEQINAFLEKKNASDPEYRYTLFHVIAAAIAKVFYLRPHMNRFYAGDRLYQRDRIVLSFVAKRRFSDNGEEALIFLPCDENTTVDTVHDDICKKVSRVREGGEQDHSTDMMDILVKFPRFILRLIRRLLYWTYYHDWTPNDLTSEDPYQASVFISNLGSIKLNAAYHHLTNWGSNSVFAVIGKKGQYVTVNDDGKAEIREQVKIGITLDERIADGYYYAKTIKLLRYLLHHPEILELPAKEEVDYE